MTGRMGIRRRTIGEERGGDRPRVCFVPTASGDSDSRPAASGYRVVRGPAREAIETELPTRYLG